MKQKQYEEALQYATLAVQVSATTGKTVILLRFKELKSWKFKANDVANIDYGPCKIIIINDDESLYARRSIL